MAQKSSPAGMLGTGAALAALVSPVRQEIVDTIEALGGEAAVAEIAAQLGRPADGIYYHLRRLTAAGVLRLAAAGADGAVRYRTAAPRGGRVRLHYGRNAPDNATAMTRVARGLLRTAERDFAAALASAAAVGEGARRNLWISRLKGWIDAEDLREINRLLVRLGELLQQPRSPQRDRLVSLAWVLAPVDEQPLRRQSPRRRTR